MKKILLVLFLALAVQSIYSDQLAWLSKEQADKTVQYFQDNDIDQVILWCACCDKDYKMMVNLSTIYYKPASDPNYYEVYIEGTNYTGGGIKQTVDLAYVHVQKGSKWHSVGELMKFECDPCTKPFKY